MVLRRLPPHARAAKLRQVSASPATQLFRFCQLELPWTLGPPDGRYLMRRAGAAPQEPAAFVLVFATLDAPIRRRPAPRGPAQRRWRQAPPEPEPVAVSTARVTVIDVGEPLVVDAARAELAGAGEPELAEGLAVLNGALHAFRLVSADPEVHEASRGQALVARIGYGAGEEVAEGRWRHARELLLPLERTRRARVLEPQAQLAAMLGARRPPLACEELALRARLDLQHGREREAALQLLIALDAALAELPGGGDRLTERLSELRAAHGSVGAAARSALSGSLSEDERQSVERTLGRLEAAIRARAMNLTDP